MGQDSHYPAGDKITGGGTSEPVVNGPVPQRHRNALGELSGEGMSNPNGAEMPVGQDTIRNVRKNY